jgi:hypothetical protein
MYAVTDVGVEIERLVYRRQALLRQLAEGHDPVLVGEHRLVDQRLSRLWEQKRAAEAERRYGSHSDILARARQEQALTRTRSATRRSVGFVDRVPEEQLVGL